MTESLNSKGDAQGKSEENLNREAHWFLAGNISHSTWHVSLSFSDFK